MRIIGVLDLAGGRAVHARAGVRARYTPVEHAAGTPVESGDARALARVYLDRLGISELYAADLDAIVDRRPQDRLTRDLASLGVPLWLDAGIQSVDDASAALERGASPIVVGLETLPSFAALAAICEGIRPLESGRVEGSDTAHVAFSLDLRNGAPIVSALGSIPVTASAETIVMRAAEAGARTVIVIDLARVGTGTGVDVALLDRLRAAVPGLPLIAGGGVSGWDDLVRIAGAGCDGALVATALHDGRIDAAEVLAARRL